ncbi:MAG: efflux RND transporter periplasmic adaptor subunit [Flavobacteriales bacterium]|nr:efflux RND transporter periplasmic adaptor subunit [Flavobacteriales bacterium]
MKLLKNIALLLAMAMAVVSCGKKASTDLDKKRAELSKKEKELMTLKGEISTLKQEIEKLDTTAKDKAIAVTVSAVGKGSYNEAFKVQGLVESNHDVFVSAEVPGNITKIYVKEGQRVSKGQAIATLDASTAHSQIAELENAMSLAKINFEKQQRLWSQKIGSEMQYLQAKNQYENLQKSLATANAQLAKFTLRSPINGTVDQIMANEGELAGSMTGGPIARIVDLSDVKIIAKVSEVYVTDLKVGQEIEVNFPSLNLTWKEKISSIGNVVDPNNRTFTVIVKPTKYQNQLRPNLLSMLTVSNKQQSNVISVPTKLIRNDGKGDYIMVVKSNGSKKTVEKRAIKIGLQDAAKTVVTEGLADGDEIIVEGFSNVIEGDEVKVANGTK